MMTFFHGGEESHVNGFSVKFEVNCQPSCNISEIAGSACVLPLLLSFFIFFSFE